MGSSFLLLPNLKSPYSFLNSLTVGIFSRQKTVAGSTDSSPVRPELLLLSLCCGGSILLLAPFAGLVPLLCRAEMTDFRARLGDVRFDIINSPISAALRLAPRNRREENGCEHRFDLVSLPIDRFDDLCCSS
ncbi:hypothetical protein G4B88_030913 [Cannabis sativa]|uniref:Uncharacterized protein n=1 Tax=Cannabis sativa TaxID=3483 RepID=A0A7J6DW90_CANSA|nr:hypothetical protein G4B88_030913 [Cannabis sativa]